MYENMEIGGDGTLCIGQVGPKQPNKEREEEILWFQFKEAESVSS